MINIAEDIHSLTDFKKNTNEFIHDLRKTGRPTVLTVNGRAELVVINAAAFQKIQKQLESKKTVLEIKQSLKDFEEGKFSESDKVFSDLKKRITTSKKKAVKNKRK